MPLGANSSQSITPFDFHGHQVRVITADDGEPRFVLNDLCIVLGLTNPSVVARRIDPDALSQAYPIPDSMGREQHPTVVDEAGMYEVILRSDKPEAVEFRRWVTREVLPSIRRTGSYGAPALTGKALLAQAVLEAQDTITALEVENREQAAQIEQDAPKVEYHDDFVADDDLLTFSTVASNLGIKESRLRELLIGHKWIYKETRTRWSQSKQKKVPRYRYTECADKKAYFDRNLHHDVPRFGGQVMHTLMITPAGAVAVTRAVRKWLGGQGELEVISGGVA